MIINDPCYVNDISRNYLVRYFCGTSDTSNTCNTADLSDASKTITHMWPDFRVILSGLVFGVILSLVPGGPGCFNQ